MKHTSKLIFATLFSLAVSGLAVAQGPGGHGPGDQGGWGRPPMERTFHDGQFGRWWDNPRIATAIGLTDDEKKKMDDIFQQHRLNLIDLHATLEKQEVLMQPMIEAAPPMTREAFRRRSFSADMGTQTTGGNTSGAEKK